METTAPEHGWKKGRLWRWAAALLLFAVVLTVYWPIVHAGLIFDDDRHITPPALRTGHGLWRLWFEVGAGFQYYPVLHTAFWVEHCLWGDSALGYHLAVLFQHAAAACLAAVIACRLGLKGAWFGALVFAIHPVSVETAGWISEQKNTLSLLLCLASALAYLRFDARRRSGHYWLALILFLLALLTKTTVAVLPGMLLVVFWWKRGRLEAKADVAPLIPWFVIGGAAGLLSGWMERTFYGAMGDSFSLNFPERILLACRAFIFYLGKLIWPSNLHFMYERWEIRSGDVSLYLYPVAIVLLLAGLLIVLVRTGSRGPLAAFLLFGGALFPVLGFLNIEWFVFSFVADHFQYLPSLGLIFPACSVVAEASIRLRNPALRLGTFALGAAYLCALGTLTWQHTLIFQSGETLFREVAKRKPENAIVHYDFATFLAKDPARNAEEAISEYRTALKLDPRNANAENNWGSLLVRLPGRTSEALTHFEAAVRIDPRLANAQSNLGILLLGNPDRFSEGLNHLVTALRLDPYSTQSHYVLGRALMNVPGKTSAAQAHFRACLEIEPGFEPARRMLGR